MKGVIYRAMFGQYDYVPRLEETHTGIKKLLFTDSESYRIAGYDQILIDAGTLSPAIKNRSLKLTAHPAVLDYDWSIYIDSNIWIANPLKPIILSFIESGSHHGAFPHVKGRTVGEELRECARLGKITHHQMQELLSDYSEQALNEKIYDNSIIFRDKKWFRSELKNEWFERTENIARDQIHLPLLLKKYDVSTHVFPMGQRDKKNRVFVVFPHHVNKENNFYKKLINVAQYLRKIVRFSIWRLRRFGSDDR